MIGTNNIFICRHFYGGTTKIRIRYDTIFKSFPLYYPNYPKCKHKILVNLKE